MENLVTNEGDFSLEETVLEDLRKLNHSARGFHLLAVFFLLLGPFSPLGIIMGVAYIFKARALTKRKGMAEGLEFVEKLGKDELKVLAKSHSDLGAVAYFKIKRRVFWYPIVLPPIVFGGLLVVLFTIITF